MVKQASYFRTLAAALIGRWALKASAVGPMIARLMLGQPVWPKRDYEKLSKEGYQQNPVVYACISLIAKSVADIPWVLYSGRGAKRKEIEEHAFLDLMTRPNPGQDRTAFLISLISHRMITGNAFIERTHENNLERMELYAHKPARMKVIPGEDGTPEAYEYQVNGMRRRFDINEGVNEPILHIKTFNPTSDVEGDWYGQSPLDACAWAIDLHNGGAAHNKALLDNSGSPAGALVFEGTPEGGNTLSPEAYEQTLGRLRGEERGYGANGNRMLLEGGAWKWQAFGLDPEKMQWLEGMNRAAREIAFTLGVPPELVGIPGDKTYSNYAEARQSFYQETVIPLAREIACALTHWFSHQLGEGVYIDVNTDNLDALQPTMEAKWKRIEASKILSLNEKREALGYDPVDGGDQHYESVGSLPLGTAATIAGGAADEDGEGKPNGKKPPAPPKPGAKHMPSGAVHSPA